MKLLKVYSKGRVLNRSLYNRVKALDAKVFPGCGDEFLANRDWWCITAGRTIVAYCGCLYRDGVCVFVRAWVHKACRGRGWQRLMIKRRLAAAKKEGCTSVVTYTTYDNLHSANNLIKCGFLIHSPAYRYAGDVLYFLKRL